MIENSKLINHNLYCKFHIQFKLLFFNIKYYYCSIFPNEKCIFFYYYEHIFSLNIHCLSSSSH